MAWTWWKQYLSSSERAAGIAPNAEKFDNQKPWAASFLFVRRGPQTYDEFIAAVRLLASPEHDARDDQHVRHFLDWRKRKCVYLVGSQVTGARALGTTRRQVRDLQKGAGEVSSLRGIKRMEFPQSVRKKTFVWCCRDGVPHCEGCGIEINARTGIIYEHVIPAGLGGEPTQVWQKIDAIRAKQASKPKHSPLPQTETTFSALASAMMKFAPDLAEELVKRFREAQREQEAGRVPEGVTRVTRARLI